MEVSYGFVKSGFYRMLFAIVHTVYACPTSKNINMLSHVMQC